jgi:hypothetical protein
MKWERVQFEEQMNAPTGWQRLAPEVSRPYEDVCICASTDTTPAGHDEALNRGQPLLVTIAPRQTIHVQGPSAKFQKNASKSRPQANLVVQTKPGRDITVDASGRVISEHVLPPLTIHVDDRSTRKSNQQFQPRETAYMYTQPEAHHPSPYGIYKEVNTHQSPQITIRQAPPSQSQARNNSRHTQTQARASNSKSAQTHQGNEASSISKRSRPAPSTTAANPSSNGSSPPRSSQFAAYQAHAYQVYAEDSGEDSAVEVSAPAPGSWRDV